MAEKKYTISIEKKDAEVTLSGELPWSEWSTHEEKILQDVAKTLKLDGFRKGAVPVEIARKHIHEMKLLTDMAEEALSRAYPIILKENNIDAIGRPSVSITKIARNNPLGFTITTAVMPDIELPDYKKIAGKVQTEKPEPVAEKEVEDALLHIRREWIRHEKYEAARKKNEEVDPASIEVSDSELGELTDEFVKKLGSFENVEGFKAKLRENMTKEKELRAHDRRRGEIIEGVVKETKVTPPAIMIESEIDRLMLELDQEVSAAGLTLEKYLQEIGKSKEDLRKEWRKSAENRVKTQLVFNEIARLEKLSPQEEETGKEVEHILKHYPQADRDSARAYATTILTNNAVIRFLEEQGAANDK